MEVAPSWTALQPGDSGALAASARDSSGVAIAGAPLTWSSSNPAVATVDASGVVRAHAQGIASISVSHAGATALADVVVAPPVLVGAGDIADCGHTDDEDTGRLLDSIPGVVFTAGDNAYANGSVTDFTHCYDPAWGRHKARTRPTLGNHDVRTGNGAPYYWYFGAVAGDSGVGYYSYDFARWHIIALNSNISMSAGSPQEQWLRADLARHPAPCALAYWHHPRFSSGEHGSSTGPEPLWQALYDARADVVINGHDHNYERFAPQTPAGLLDTARGIREFVVGTGGADFYQFPIVRPNSLVRINTVHGVLKLTLRPTGYDWAFIDTDRVVRDSGSGRCH
jgi:hypothetical protein